MANKDEIIQHFIEPTGVDVEVATFYLESSNWNIERALSSYYGEDADEGEADIMEQAGVEGHRELVNEGINNVNVASESVKSKNTYTAKSKIATLSSLRQPDSDDDDEDRRGQAFYVGGSEHGGGQQILGPPKIPKKTKESSLDALFKSAQSHGAEVVSREVEDDHVASNKPFSGSGFRLGDSSTEPTVRVNAHSSKPEGPQPVKVAVRIWNNGFSVNDGALRSLTEPNDVEFLSTLARGQIPAELLQEHKYAKIDLSMEDRSSEDFREPPRPKMVPFHGSGKMLGSPTPAMSASLTLDNDAGTPAAVVVNDREPMTQIQVRLADNSRMVAHLNHDHTIADLRRHIVNLHPQYRRVHFSLVTAFPSKLLADESISLKDANLLNSVVLQRLA